MAGQENETKYLYMDESGECSFSARSCYNHFLIAIVSVDHADKSRLKNTVKRWIRSLIKAGWPKAREPKASEIFQDNSFGAPMICDFLEKLVRIPSFKVSYIVVNKSAITNNAFRNAPYGTAYNYFCSQLLLKMMFSYKFHNIDMIYDRRNKETHSNKHFREYLITKITGTALEKNKEISYKINGHESHNNYGLIAVDLCSWGLFRKFERNDNTFYDVLKRNVLCKKEWYIR